MTWVEFAVDAEPMANGQIKVTVQQGNGNTVRIYRDSIEEAFQLAASQMSLVTSLELGGERAA